MRFLSGIRTALAGLIAGVREARIPQKAKTMYTGKTHAPASPRNTPHLYQSKKYEGRYLRDGRGDFINLKKRLKRLTRRLATTLNHSHAQGVVMQGTRAQRAWVDFGARGLRTVEQQTKPHILRRRALGAIA